MRNSLIFLSLMFALIQRPVVAQDAIRIGLLTDLSGAGSFYGHQTRVGAMLAEKELKAQGKAVQVIFEDTALSTSRSLSAAQKLLFIDKVDALYVDFTVTAVAVSSLLEQQQKVMIYSAAAESVARKNEFAFKTYSDYSLGCESLAKEFIKDGVRRIGVLKAETEYGDLCAAGAQRVTAVVQESYQQGESVGAQMLRLRGKGVEALLSGGFEGDTINILKAAAEIKYKVRIGVPEDTLKEKTQERFASALNGSMTFGLQQLSEQFIENARRVDGGDSLSGFEGVGLGYVHLKQLFAAVAACHEKSGKCVAQAMSAQGADSEIGFEGWKNRIAKLRTVLKRYSGGNLEEIGSYILADN